MPGKEKVSVGFPRRSQPKDRQRQGRKAGGIGDGRLRKGNAILAAFKRVILQKPRL
jgi:hypothetical protein